MSILPRISVPLFLGINRLNLPYKKAQGQSGDLFATSLGI